MHALTIDVIPCLRDNYAYLVTCAATGRAAVVDPSQADPVAAAVEQAGVELVTILNTHHHWDHTGGNKALLARWPDLDVAGHASDRGRIHGQTRFLEAGDAVEVGALRATVRHLPGHTTGAVAYCFPGEVFTGDTLFYAGCGRLFEGTPEMMYRSLTAELCDTLPADTRIWCGHEYTVQNLRFAATVEPNNPDIAERLAWAEAERAAGRATVPSTVGVEQAVNPFVRAGSVAELGRRRLAKDAF